MRNNRCRYISSSSIWEFEGATVDAIHARAMGIISTVIVHEYIVRSDIRYRESAGIGEQSSSQRTRSPGDSDVPVINPIVVDGTGNVDFQDIRKAVLLRAGILEPVHISLDAVLENHVPVGVRLAREIRVLYICRRRIIVPEMPVAVPNPFAVYVVINPHLWVGARR